MSISNSFQELYHLTGLIVECRRFQVETTHISSRKTTMVIYDLDTKMIVNEIDLNTTSITVLRIFINCINNENEYYLNEVVEFLKK